MIDIYHMAERAFRVFRQSGWGVAPSGNLHAALAALELPGVPRPHRGDGLDNQRRQHPVVHICQLLDVEAAFAGSVLAEFGEQIR